MSSLASSVRRSRLRAAAAALVVSAVPAAWFTSVSDHFCAATGIVPRSVQLMSVPETSTSALVLPR